MVIDIGDVIDLKLESFRHDKGASGHPAIVVNVIDNDIFVAICTDSNHAKSHPYSITIDWKSCGLSKPTIVICDKLGKISSHNILNQRGKVSKEDLNRIRSAIEIYGGSERMFEDYIF